MAHARIGGGLRAAAILAAVLGSACARNPVVEPSDGATHARPRSSRAGVDGSGDGGSDASSNVPRATLERGDPLLIAFRNALLRDLPPSRGAILREVDLTASSAIAPRRLAFFALDRAVHFALPDVLEPVASRRAVRLRAMRPLASVHALEVLRDALAGAATQVEHMGAGAGCASGSCADASTLSCAALAADQMYQAMEDLESAEEDAMESQRWLPDGARWRHASSAGAETIGRADEVVLLIDPEGDGATDADLYRVAMRSCARAFTAAWACAPPGADADLETLRALAIFAATGSNPGRDGGR